MTTKQNKLDEAMRKVFEFFDKDKVAAVYLTGSMLNNLEHKDSDVDFYVVLHQSKKNLVFGQFESGTTDGEYDFKYMESYKFIQMLCKTNPNMLELVFKYPLYVSKTFKPIADFLFENKNEVVTLNKSRYFSGSYHMLKNNYNKIKNGSGRTLKGEAGKEVMNFYKVYYQSLAIHENKDITPYVLLTGELKEFLFNIKMITSYTEKETSLLLNEMELMLEELDKRRQPYENMPINDEFVNKLIDLL